MFQHARVLGKRLGLAALCFVLLLLGLAQSAPPAHAQSREFFIPDMYQIQNTGPIWQYDGGGFHSWTELDNNPESFYLIAREDRVYQVHTNDHTLWAASAGQPGVWTELDNNLSTSSLAAGGFQLYQMHTTGSIWQYAGRGFHSWTELDDNPNTTQIAAGGNQLYQLHKDGSVWKYDGGGFHSWTQIDTNPNGVFILATETGTVYEMRSIPGSNGGSIFQYAGGSWIELDNNPHTTQLAATDTTIYEMHDDGSIWRYNGGGSWIELDNNPDSVIMVASVGQKDTLYQKHRDGSVWQYAGGGFHSWTELDANPVTMNFADPADRLDPPTG